MQVTLYAVGSPIDVAKYSSWLSQKIAPVTAIPLQKVNDEISTHVILKTLFTDLARYFADHGSASIYATQQMIKHEFDDRILSAPSIFKLKAEINTKTDEYSICKIVSCELLEFSERIINKDPSEVEFNNSFFSLFSSSSRPKKLTCTPKNFEGNFEDLMPYKEAFTFLCGLHKSPTELPTNVRKKICEYIVEKPLRSIQP